MAQRRKDGYSSDYNFRLKQLVLPQLIVIEPQVSCMYCHCYDRTTLRMASVLKHLV